MEKAIQEWILVIVQFTYCSLRRGWIKGTSRAVRVMQHCYVPLSCNTVLCSTDENSYSMDSMCCMSNKALSAYRNGEIVLLALVQFTYCILRGWIKGTSRAVESYSTATLVMQHSFVLYR